MLALPGQDQFTKTDTLPATLIFQRDKGDRWNLLIEFDPSKPPPNSDHVFAQ